MESRSEELRKLSVLREGVGVEIMLSDPSSSAGFRFGHAFKLVSCALVSQRLVGISEEEREALFLEALITARAYLSGDYGIIPLDFVPPEVKNYSLNRSDRTIDVLRDNCFHILNNLGENAKNLVSADSNKFRGMIFSHLYGHLVSSLRPIGEGANIEQKIRGCVDSFNRSFEYATNVAGQIPDFFEFVASDKTLDNLRILFNGYREGKKVRGTYCFETNVEQYCRTREKIILGINSSVGIPFFGRTTPSEFVKLN